MLSLQIFVSKDPNHLYTLGLLSQSNEGGARLLRDPERLQYTCLSSTKSTTYGVSGTQRYLMIANNLLVDCFQRYYIISRGAS